jgi:hypothetical protein
MHTSLPFLELLASPLGLVLLVALGLGAAAQGLARRAALHDLPLRAQRQPFILFLLAALPYLIAGWNHGQRLSASGDEPHYLLMAQSLARSGDLDLRDEFVRGDYREYVPELAAPHYGAPRADGRPYPAHSPGLPLLLAPIYALGGRAACLAWMALLAAALGVQIHALALQAGATPAAALWAWAAASLGPPLCFYSMYVYTEVPSALALALALRLLPGVRGRARAVAAALCAVSLPWLHVKMVPVAALLGLWVLLRERGVARRWFLGVAGLGALGFLAYYQIIFGQASPLALYGGLPRGVQPAPLRAALGMLWDRSFGLLPYAPVWVLALAGLPIALSQAWTSPAQATRDRLRLHLAVLLALLGPILIWRMWWGGQCPPSRFLVPALPTLGVLLALRLSDGPARGLARLRFSLTACGFVLAGVLVAQPAERLLLNRRDRPSRAWEALAGEVSLGRYLPSLVYPADEQTRRIAGVWMAWLLAALVLDARRRRDRSTVPTLTAHVVAGVALMGVLVTIDHWARRDGAPAPVASPALGGEAGEQGDAPLP